MILLVNFYYIGPNASFGVGVLSSILPVDDELLQFESPRFVFAIRAEITEIYFQHDEMPRSLTLSPPHQQNIYTAVIECPEFCESSRSG